MAEASLPVDLRNPGQVFACLGLMEAAERLFADEQGRPPRVQGRYIWSDGETRARFAFEVEGVDDPLGEVIVFLTRATAESLNAPRHELGDKPVEDGLVVRHDTAKWDVATQTMDAEDPEAAVFPFPPPDSPAPLPVRLSWGERHLPISSWGDDTAVGRDNVKFWAGSGGYPGAALARDALALVEGLKGEALASAVADPFAFAAPQSSSFSFDWRRSYVPLNAGFSPNAHGDIRMVGFPFVELLAAVGLEHARPERPDRANKLAYRYAVSDATLPTVLARAVLGGADLGVLSADGAQGLVLRRFHIQLDWPGQKDQARCIIDSRED